jgi:hypothetical protein
VLSRGLFDPNSGTQIVAHSLGIRDRIERAFAAELLAPAEGVAVLLGGDLSSVAREKVAHNFGVDRLLLDHQIENQLDSPSRVADWLNG